MVWRNDWEKATRGGRTWDVVQSGGTDTIGGMSGIGGRGINVLPPGEAERLQKAAEEADDAPTQVSRDDTGRGLDMSSLFDPNKNNTVGQPPSVDPLNKLQEAQILLNKTLETVVQGLGQTQQMVQELAQQGASSQQMQEALTQELMGIKGQLEGAAAGMPAAEAPPQEAAPPRPPPPGPEQEGMPPEGPPPEGMPPEGMPPGAEGEAPPPGMEGMMAPPVEPQRVPEVGPDGLTLDQNPGGGAPPPEGGAGGITPDLLAALGMDPHALAAQVLGEDPNLQAAIEAQRNPPVPPGLEFEPGEDPNVPIPKRELPPQPGSTFTTPGAELAAGLPPTIRYETNIKTGGERITPSELLEELNQKFGHSWVDWEMSTIYRMWTNLYGAVPEEVLVHKIAGLQTLVMNTSGFWSIPQIFRDVILTFNGKAPLHDQPEDEYTLSPGELAYGLDVARQIAPPEAIQMKEPGDAVKQYTAYRLLVHGLIVALYPMEWAQPYLDHMAARNAQLVAGIDKGAVIARFKQVMDLPLMNSGLDDNSPIDQQVIRLMLMHEHVAEMEGGV